jgi:hypothetical protein
LTAGGTKLRGGVLVRAAGGHVGNLIFVALALDEDVENETFLVDSAPERMFLGGDGDDDLVEVPFVAAARGSPTDAVGEFPAGA